MLTKIVRVRNPYISSAEYREKRLANVAPSLLDGEWYYTVEPNVRNRNSIHSYAGGGFSIREDQLADCVHPDDLAICAETKAEAITWHEAQHH